MCPCSVSKRKSLSRLHQLLPRLASTSKQGTSGSKPHGWSVTLTFGRTKVSPSVSKDSGKLHVSWKRALMTSEFGSSASSCTLSVLGGVATSDTCTATVPTGSTGEVAWTTTTATASMVILDATSTEVYNSASAGTFALAAGTYDLTMTESNPLADTFATNQVTVTVTDQDGTATSQTFHMNVTNVNDAFSLGSYSLSIAGDVHDGATMTPGYADTVTTTLCSITNPAGSGSLGTFCR